MISEQSVFIAIMLFIFSSIAIVGYKIYKRRNDK